MEEQITQFLINLAPAIAAVATIIVSTVTIIKSLKQTSSEIRSDADIKTLVEDNQKLRKDNQALVQAMREQTKELNKTRQEMQRRNYRK